MSDRRHNTSDSGADIYSDMSTDELENLIDYFVFEDSVDSEQINVMMEAYNKRVGIPKIDVAAMWEDFEQNYSGYDETFPQSEADNNLQTDRRKSNNLKKLRRFGMSVAAAIAVMVIFFTSTAYGASTWQRFTNWTSRTIGFSRTPAIVQISYELAPLHEALEELGITESLVPTWIPERFTLDEVSVIEMPEMTIILAYFYYADSSLVFQIDTVDHDLITLFEKDPGEPTIYSRDGINHYIISNYGRTTALWTTGHFDISFSGDISESEATRMIDSIYER